jgi:hypothetical protein
MPAGIIFRIGGALDPTYKTALAQSVAEAKAANLQINAQAQATAAMTRTDLGLQEKAFLVSRARSLSEQSAIRKQINDLKLVQAAMVAKSPLASAEKVAVADAIAKKEAEIEILQANRAALEVGKIKNDAGLKLTAAETVRLKNAESEYVAIVKKGQDEEIAGQKLTKLEEVAAAKAADEEQVAANQAKIEAIMAQEKLAGRVYEDEKAAQMAAADILYAEEVAAAKAADEEQIAANQAKIEAIMAQEKLAGRVYEDEKAAQMAAADILYAEEVAAAKAASLAEIAIVARQGGIGAAAGGHGHKYGGKGGIVSEVAVIGHELLQGRGTGRILGSISILAQRLGLLGKLVKSTAQEEIQAAFKENALAGSMSRTAISAEKCAATSVAKAAATRADTTATEFDIAAAEELSAANLELAETSRIAAAAQIEKAAATTEAAEIAAASAAVSLGPLGWVLLGVVAAIGLLVIGYKTVNAFIKVNTESQIHAQQAALKLKLSFTEEAEAMKKLQEAAEKTEEAFRKLNETHDDYPQKVDDYIAAMKREQEAHAALADAKKQAALLDVEIAEKSGAMSHQDAVRKKAQIEKQAIADNAKREMDDARDRDYAFVQMNQYADEAAKSAQAQAQAASDKINSSPEGKAKAARLAQLEKIAKDTADAADKADKDAAGLTGSKRTQMLGEAGTRRAVANFAASQRDSFKSDMKPDEIAAADAMRNAEETASAAKSIGEQHHSALQDWLEAKSKFSPEAVKAQQGLIDKQTQLDLMSGGGHERRSATERERVGIGAPQVANLQKQTLDVTKLQLQQARILNGKIDKLIASGGGANNPDGW